MTTTYDRGAQERDPTIGQLWALVREQHARIARLEREREARDEREHPSVDRLDTREGASPTAAQHLSRATMLRLVGMGAAGVAGAVALEAGRSLPAQAATNGNLVLGQTNDADASTSLMPTAGSIVTLPLLEVYNGNGTAVYGNGGSSPPGVQGSNTGPGAGLYGQNLNNGTGVEGHSFADTNARAHGSGIGVWGQSGSGDGVHGQSQSGYGGTFLGGVAPLRLYPAGAPGSPNTPNHQQGEIYVDSNGDFWVCTASGTPSSPGSFLKLATTDRGLHSFPDPRRVMQLAMTNGQTSSATSALTTITNVASGVPQGAQAAWAAVQSYDGGVLTIFPDGQGDPGIANWAMTGASGALKILYMLVPLSSAGAFKVHAYFTSTIYVDVWGYLY